MSDSMPKTRPDRISENIFGRVPESMPDRISVYMSDKMPEENPGRMSGRIQMQWQIECQKKKKNGRMSAHVDGMTTQQSAKQPKMGRKTGCLSELTHTQLNEPHRTTRCRTRCMLEMRASLKTIISAQDS